MKTLKFLTIFFLGLLSLQSFAGTARGDSISPHPSYQFIQDTLLKVDWTHCQLYATNFQSPDQLTLDSIHLTPYNASDWDNEYAYYYSSNDSMIHTFNISNVPDTFYLKYYLHSHRDFNGDVYYDYDSIQIIKPQNIIINNPTNPIDTLISIDSNLIINQNDYAIIYSHYFNEPFDHFYYTDSIHGQDTIDIDNYIIDYNYCTIDSIYYYQYIPNKSTINYNLLIYTICTECPTDTTTTNINNLTNNNKFTFYPNPSSNYINIKTENITSIYIFNSIGKLVLIQKVNNNSKINISQLTKGIYYIKTDIIDTSTSYKLIVE